MRRPRGPGGRFLTADEVAAMEKKSGDSVPSGQENIQTTAVKPASSAGHKRKSSEVNDDVDASKKTRTVAPARTSAGVEESEADSADASDDDG